MKFPFKVFAVAAALALAPRPGLAQAMVVAGVEEVPAGEFELYLEDRPAGYAGEYHFGDSEEESTLELTVAGDRVTGVLTYATFENDNWVPREVRLTGGRIVGAMLVAPEWSGVFVRLGRQRGLILFRNPTDWIRTEFGAKLPWVN